MQQHNNACKCDNLFLVHCYIFGKSQDLVLISYNVYATK